MTIAIGQDAPPFELFDQDRNALSLETLRGSSSLIVFIPFPFTGRCEGELCAIRDRYSELESVAANVVAITCDTLPANKAWSDANSFAFPVLSDFWPHGDVSRSYGVFNEAFGCADRVTFVLNADAVVTDVVASEGLGFSREFDSYATALRALSARA
jgi:peroxiredoxin